MLPLSFAAETHVDHAPALLPGHLVRVGVDRARGREVALRDRVAVGDVQTGRSRRSRDGEMVTPAFEQQPREHHLRPVGPDDAVAPHRRCDLRRDRIRAGAERNVGAEAGRKQPPVSLHREVSAAESAAGQRVDDGDRDARGVGLEVDPRSGACDPVAVRDAGPVEDRAGVGHRGMRVFRVTKPGIVGVDDRGRGGAS
jgi:hypothetical protein